MKKSMIFLVVFALLITSIVIFTGDTSRNGNIITETIQELAVNLDEETNMYRFAYKKSVLNVSKEKFDEYKLTNENIWKFFDKMEKVYALYADFFLVYNLPDIFTYNSVTREYMESVGVFVDAFSVGTENATYYVEGWLEGYLKNIDKGLPSIVAHEVGHLYTFCWRHGGVLYNSSKYVWDCEVFAVIATEYLLSQSDFKLLNASGGIYLPITVTQKNIMKEDWYDEFFKNYQGFIHYKMSTINEKYGYDTLHEVMAEMIKKDTEVSHNDEMDDVDTIEMFDLFFDIYAEKTGENVKEKYFTQEQLYVVYKNINSYWEQSMQ